MNRIKKPTALLMGGHAGEGKLILSDEWASNGHWLIRLDCLQTMPTPTKGIVLAPESASMIPSIIKNAEQSAYTLCELTGEYETVEIRRYTHARSTSEKTDPIDHVEFANVQKDGSPGAYRVWANLAYIEWLAGIGETTWFMSRSFGDPFRVENKAGETIAILSPVRK